jgi:hypothetical protein
MVVRMLRWRLNFRAAAASAKMELTRMGVSLAGLKPRAG